MNVKQMMKSDSLGEKRRGTDNVKVFRSNTIEADWVLKHTAPNSHDMTNDLLHSLEDSPLDVASKKLFSSSQGRKLCQME